MKSTSKRIGSLLDAQTKQDQEFINSLSDEYTPTDEEIAFHKFCSSINITDENGKPLEPATDEEDAAQEEDD